MTKQDTAGSSLARRHGGLVASILIALVTLIMLIWSWGTWPDPLVDFGAQLYVPWQITTGHVLYRDIAYYNGPLSSYLNSAAFYLLGTGISTLVWLNLLIMAAAMTVAYRVTVRASGRWSAFMGGLTFALIFAFSQVVFRLGNYNWLTPYTHEITHGTALGLAAIAAAARYQSTGKTAWISITGGLLGAVFSTKAEPTAASFAAVAAMLVGGWWVERTGRRQMVSAIAILIVSVLVVPLAAWMLLAAAMPASQAFRGVLGSWPWALDQRITSLHFYREVAGLNDIPRHLTTLLDWTLIYSALIAAGIGLGLCCRSPRIRNVVSIGAFLACLAIIRWAFSEQLVTGMLTPLPIFLGFALLMSGIAVLRRSRPAAALRFGLVVFAIVLVAKMGLNTCAYQYGFVLAWPGTVVMVCAFTADFPAWIERHGGSGRIIKAIGLAAWIGAASGILVSDKLNFDRERYVIDAGTRDEFRGDRRALQVQEVCAEIEKLVPRVGTVTVLPQGLMINYLTRLTTPTRNINFMPPEVLAAGESNILGGFRLHPPDVVVLTPSVIEHGHFTLDDRDPYGADTLRWVLQNYRGVEASDAEALQQIRQYGQTLDSKSTGRLMILVRGVAPPDPAGRR
jgi:hypothetical protein